MVFVLLAVWVSYAKAFVQQLFDVDLLGFHCEGCGKRGAHDPTSPKGPSRQTAPKGLQPRPHGRSCYLINECGSRPVRGAPDVETLVRADESDKMRAVFEREKVVRRTPVKEALVESTSFFR